MASVPGDLPTCFEAAVQTAPDAVALRYRAVGLSYYELDQRANHLAHELRRLGALPGTPVGLCVPRSFAWPQGVLAILKAECVYLPLDPAYPNASLDAILRDSGADLLITTSRLRGRFADWTGQVVAVDRQVRSWTSAPTDPPERRLLAERLAYVMYTSGSTGRPKGVAIPHRGPVNYFAYLRRDYGLGPGDVVLQLAPPSFDASVRDLLGPLACGATVVLREAGTPPDPAALICEIVRHEVSAICSIIPGMLDRLVAAAELSGETVSTLRLMLTSAEPLTVALARRAEQVLGCRVVNQYGATECTMSTTRCGLDGAASSDTVLPAGSPIPGTELYVLDESGEPGGVGAAGEIYIGGAGLADGYWNDPQLTAERFVVGRPGGGPERRLYRTGDRGLLRPDGQLMYLGRVDNQIKVRGYRVAPEEIEACLRQQARVRDAVVIGRPDVDGTRLDAYLLVGHAEPTVEEIRDHLARHLPGHLHPHRLLLLDELPRNHNGKVDRAAVAALPTRELATDTTASRLDRPVLDGPREREEALADMCREVLHVDRVSRDDNFFALGGDSLRLFDLLVKARAAGIPLPYADALQDPTVRGFAAAAATRQAGGGDPPSAGAFPLSPPQAWLFSLDHPERDHWNQARSLQIPPGIDPARLRNAVLLTVRRHAALRLRFIAGDGGYRQEYRDEPAASVWRDIDFGVLGADAAGCAIREVTDELNTGLDLAAGVPFRVCYLRPGPRRPGMLVLVAHQLVVDGLSWRILLADLQRAAFGAEPESANTPSISFRQWVEHLVASTRGRQSELPYWLAQGDGVTPVPTELSTMDGQRLGNRAADAAAVTHRLTVAETAALVRAAQAVRIGVDDVLLGGVACALASWLGESAVLVDIGWHGRHLGGADVSATVGWFVSQAPVRLALRPGLSIADAARLIAERRTEQPDHGAGFGLLRYLGSAGERRSLAQRPRADISFNHLGSVDRPSRTAKPTVAEVSQGTLSGRAQRPHLLEVGSTICHGRCRVTWTYNGTVHRRSTVERLAAAQVAAVRRLSSAMEDH